MQNPQYPAPSQTSGYPVPAPPPAAPPVAPAQLSYSGQPFTFEPPRETKELAYHRLAFADHKSRWWKPLVEGVLGVVFYLVFSVLMMLGFAIYMFSSGSAEIGGTLKEVQQQALTSPAVFLMMFGNIALMFPSLWLARLIMGPRPWGLVHSVAGRIRWGWMGVCFGISALLYVLIPTLLELLLNGAEGFQPVVHSSTLVWMLVLIVLVVPVQCYAEELVFRGYLMQTIGRWLRHPAWAIVLPAPLFMVGHLYDFWGQASILAMGMAAGFMVWYTGGLEAGIAMHVVNNLNLMLFGVLGGAVDPFAQEGLTFVDFLMAVGVELLLVGAVMYAARVMGVARTGTFSVVMSPQRWREVQEAKAGV